jgi:hypothetical protein
MGMLPCREWFSQCLNPYGLARKISDSQGLESLHLTSEVELEDVIRIAVVGTELSLSREHRRIHCVQFGR